MQFTQETLIHKRYKRARTNASFAKIENRLDEILRGDTPLDTVPAVTTELSNNDQIYLEENGLDTTEWTRLENDDDFENISFSFEDDEIVSDREEEEDILSDRETTDPTVNSNSKYIERDIYVSSYPFSPIQEYSVRLMNICEETNICREGHRLLSRLINEIIADTRIGKTSKILAREACDTLVKTKVPVDLVTSHEICGANGCYLYDIRKDISLTACPICGATRSKTSTLKTVNITDKIAELLICDDVRERLAYRADNFPKDFHPIRFIQTLLMVNYMQTLLRTIYSKTSTT
ncbi:hypothetical protein INT48_005321 [Thamnidium elegans]|uniref:Uncharacterized protein n=1 Tax=Thamnidium elegans TaxID=101142 RepID=A0A8H7SIY3_9FUNG|nr:hypothetical protein INT48_005321 [Thamnidium elegans]